jgi:hypothetical protein
MLRARDQGLGIEDHGLLGEAVRRVAGAHDAGGGEIAFSVGVGKVDRPVVREAGVEGDVEQAALVAAEDLGRAGNRRLAQSAVLDQSQGTVLLRHQHAAIGQEGQGPGLLEPAGHLHHPEGCGLGPHRSLRGSMGAAAAHKGGNAIAEKTHGRSHSLTVRPLNWWLPRLFPLTTA